MMTLSPRGIRGIAGTARPGAQASVQFHSHDTATAVITGELDLATAGQIADVVLDAIDGGARHIVMDMSGVTFCDSQGLNALVRICGRAQAAGGDMVLTGVRPGPARLLRVTGLDRRFTFGSSLDNAAPAA